MSTIPASCALGAGKTGLAIGYRVLNITRDETVVFTVAGVVETAVPGTYAADGGIDVGVTTQGYIEWGVAGTKYAEGSFDTGASLTAQGVADALKLAPAAGAPAAGSVNADLDTLTTGVNVTSIGGQAASAVAPVAFPAAVGTSTYAGADTAGTATLLARLTLARAGYLDALAGWTTTVLAGLRALARSDVAANADIGGTHDPALHSEQALAAAVAAVPTAADVAAELVAAGYAVTDSDQVTADNIGRRRGDGWTITLLNLGNVVGWTKFAFTIKYRVGQFDADAVLQLVDDVISVVLGVAATDGQEPLGSITCNDEATGDFTISVNAAVTALLPVRKGLLFDLQGIDASGDPHTIALGTFDITYDVTRAVE